MADLTAARNKSRDLRLDLPRRVGKLADALRSIRSDLEAPGPDVLPGHDLEILRAKIDNLLGKVEDKYPDRDSKIDEVPEAIAERIIELDATLEALRAHLIESQSYKDFARHLKRIDSVLPPLDYDFTCQIELLRHENESCQREWLPSAINCLGDLILNGLDDALNRFRDRQYEDAPRCASQTNQLLVANLLSYLAKTFPNPGQLKNLHDGRQQLWNRTGSEGRSRLEWLAVALAELSECVRNSVEHPESDAETPAWMIQRRGVLRRDPCVARLVLSCQLHLALELHQLWQNAPTGTSP